MWPRESAPDDDGGDDFDVDLKGSRTCLPVSFRCVINALKDPEAGDLLIVHDGSQGLYGNHGSRWKDVGVKAVGRSRRNAALDNIKWLTSDGESRTKIMDDNAKLLTIHATKGLQFRAIILICCDQMPAGFDDAEADTDRRLMYVALTKAQEMLVITHCGDGAFVTEVAKRLTSGR